MYKIIALGFLAVLMLTGCPSGKPAFEAKLFDSGGVNNADAKDALDVSNSNFGNFAVGSARTAYLEISNSRDLEISNIRIEGLAHPFELEDGQFPGRTGSCPSSGTLAAFATCQVAIRIPEIAPIGDYVKNISVVYFVNGIRYERSVTLMVSITDSGAIEIDNLDFGAVVVNDTVEKTLTIRNRSASAEAHSLQFHNYSTQFIINNPASCSKIAPNDECTLKVKFSPYFTGIEDVDIAFDYRYGSRLKSDKVNFRGQALTADRVGISGGWFGFLSVPYNTIAKIDIEVENQGSRPISGLTVSNLSGGITVDPASSCNSVLQLASGAKCVFQLDLGAVTSYRTVNVPNMTLSFNVGSSSKTEIVSVFGNLNAVFPPEEVVVNNNSNNFGIKNVPTGQRGQITLTLGRTAGLNVITKIAINTLPAGAILDPLSTCPTVGLPNSASTCTFVLDWGLVPNVKDINQSLQIDYDVSTASTTASKNKSVWLRGRFNPVGPSGKKIANIDITGEDFGHLVQFAGASTTVDIAVLNNVGGNKIKKIKLKGLSILDPIKVLSNTCGGTLAPGGVCKFVLSVKQPVNTVSPYSKVITLKYTEKKVVKTKSISLTGHLDLRAPAPISPGPVIKDNDFGSKILFFGDSFISDIGIENPAAATQPITIKSLGRKNGWQTWLSIDPTNTDCDNKVLAPGDTCIYSIKATPSRVHSGPKHVSDLILTYEEASVQNTKDFNWEGKWTLQNRPQAPQVTLAKTSPENNAPPVVIYVEATTADKKFGYKYRPLRTDAKAIAKYGHPLLAKIALHLHSPTTAHVPWSITVPNPQANTPLVDIAPDRIVDKKTKKKYVKGYHGTTSEILSGFADGADFISFSAAKNMALGPGFYITFDVNEAANYAQDRLDARRWTGSNFDPGLQAIIVVLGLEEDVGVQGKEASGWLSDHNGAPTDPSVFFRRNSGMFNQGVYFENIRDHLKIFEIWVMPDGFGMASSYDDGDGKPEGSSSPIARCNQKELDLVGQDFSPLTVANGASGKITVNVTNTYTVSFGRPFGTTISDLQVEGLDKADIIAVDPNSTCITMGTLAQNATCQFDFNIKPPANLDNYRRPLRISYLKDGAKVRTVFPFSLSGTIDIAGGGAAANCNVNTNKWDYGTKDAGPIVNVQSPFINNPLPNTCGVADAKLENRLMRRLFEPVPDTTGQKIAIIMMGAPGAGKSASRREAFKKLGIKGSDVVTIDPDELRAELPDFKRYTEVKSPLCPNKFRAFTNATAICLNSGRALRDKALEQAFKSNKNFLFDTPCADTSYCRDSIIAEAVKNGFVPYVVAVYAKKSDTLTRAKDRALETGRYIDSALLSSTYDAIKGNFTSIADAAIAAGGKALIYDNQGLSPVLVFEKNSFADTCAPGTDACDYFVK